MPDSRRRITYIEGLRGILSIMVFMCHFTYSFYFTLYSTEPVNMHNNIEPYIATTAFNVLYNGKAALRLFLLISGYVMANKYFNCKGRGFLKELMTRYIRLTVPIILAETAAFIILKHNMFFNINAATISKSEWLSYFYNFNADIREFIKECIYGCLLNGSNKYLGVLWIMKYEFIGALVIYILCKYLKGKNYRYFIYAIVIVLSGVADKDLGYMTIISGVILYDVNTLKCFKVLRIKSIKLLGLIMSLILLTYPPAGKSLDETIYKYLGTPRVIIFYVIGAAIFFYILTNSAKLQMVFNSSLLRIIGKYSEGIYFTHFIVMASFSSWFLVKYNALLSYNKLMFINFILTIIITAASSVILVKLKSSIIFIIDTLIGNKHE